jgi:HEAT repeat protein
LALVERRKPDKKESEHSPEAGSKLYEPEYEEKQRFEHQAWLQQILEKGESKTKGKRIALIGEPGAGKTTTLQDIAFWVLKKDLGLPIWISLADLGRNENLIDFPTYLFENWLNLAVSPSQKEIAKQELETQIQQGRVWLLLDGVDEVATSGGQILQHISQQLTGWLAQSRVLLTCRLNVWQADLNFLSNFETYRLLDFNYPQRVHQFIHNWFSNRDISKGERLKTELNNPDKARLRDLIQNPLRLTLLCSSWQSNEANLPDTKAGLYAQFVQQFYKWKSNCFPINTRQQEELNLALGHLAIKDINGSNSRFRLRESFINKELGYPDEESSLFNLALKLGWLNCVGIAAELSVKEKVYAFFHPTFEEYFAACAINDWDFFLPRDHVDKPVEGKEYRVFEKQWKEVILLWLGRENIAKEEKEEFINALVDFQDGCGDVVFWFIPRRFYRYRAYCLAAVGINEFKECSRTKKIVEQVVYWVVQNNPISAVKTLAETALTETNRVEAIAALVKLMNSISSEVGRWLVAKGLEDIAPRNEKDIKALDKLVDSTSDEDEDDYVYWKAADSLGKINPGNEVAITALVKLMNSTFSKVGRWQVAESLGNIAPGNKVAITALVRVIKSTSDEDDYVRWQVAESLGKIDPGNQTAITVLIDLIGSETDKSIRRLAAESLGNIAPGNQTASAALVRVIESTSDEDDYVRWLAAESLGNIDPENEVEIEDLVRVIESTNDKDHYVCWQEANLLKKVLTKPFMPKVVKALKNTKKQEAIEILWDCAQNLSYSEFYSAWHS